MRILSLLCVFCLGSCARVTPAASTGVGACRVDLYSVPWDAEVGSELDEDGLVRLTFTRRHRVVGCDYAEKLKEWMQRARLLAPAAVPPAADLRLLARVVTPRGSWLLGLPVTCHFVRLDRTRYYALDPELVELLSRPLEPDERQAIERFGGC